MKAVVQRVKCASVKVDSTLKGEIEAGLLVLLGAQKGDTDTDADVLARKLASLRIFSDQQGKMNLSIKDIDGGMLVISNFTLCADTKKGNRPSFDPAMPPSEAGRLYELVCSLLCQNGIDRVEKGVFGADMQVELINDGPVTLVLDTAVWRK